MKAFCFQKSAETFVQFGQGQIADETFVAVAAKCTLDGWGSFSNELGRHFIARFLTAAERPDLAITANWLKESPVSTFRDAVEVFTPDAPEWSSGEFVAIVIHNGSATIAWAGGLYGAVFHQGRAVAQTHSHSMEFDLPNGKRMSTMTRLLVASTRHEKDSMPDVVGPVSPVRPFVFACGNVDISCHNWSPVGRGLVQKILTAENEYEFVVNCEEFQRKMVEPGPDATTVAVQIFFCE